MPDITRGEARRIAEQYLVQNELPWATGEVREVLAWDEIYWRKPAVYGAPTKSWNNQWIVYLERPDTGFSIHSSLIIAVDRHTGEVSYAGDAHDEG